MGINFERLRLNKAKLNRDTAGVELVNALPAAAEETVRDFEILEPEVMDWDAGDETAGEQTVVQMVNSIISEAVENNASDIHIEPVEDKLVVRQRVDGVLFLVRELASEYKASLVLRVKIMAGLNIAEKRVPQDGRMKIDYKGRKIDLRVSSMPVVYGEKIAVRILDKRGEIFTLDRLGFQEENLSRFKELLDGSGGMILLTGPTGSGKTTTLYAALEELNTPGRNIFTIEDPVEYVFEGINQARVNQQAGLDFAGGLRAILRQDPDIIMVGEIRDTETAVIAVRPAIAGQLVFSTLHTRDAAGALVRLMEMGIEHYLLASSMLGIVGQRLVRKICPYCKVSRELPSQSAECIFINFGPGDTVLVYEGEGCSYCNYTGYRGRTSIQEVLPVTDRIRHCLAEKSPAEAIKHAAAAEGMITLREDGIRKVLQGITTVQEVMKQVNTKD